MQSLQNAFKTSIGGRPGESEDTFFCKDNLFIMIEGEGEDNYVEAQRAQACRVIYDSFFRKLSELQSSGKALVFALKEANEHAFSKNQEEGQELSMSVSAVYIRDNTMSLANLGDSHVYCIYEGNIEQLTKDHTVSSEPFSFGKVSIASPVIPVLNNGNRVHEKTPITAKSFNLRKNELILMATGGLTRVLSDEDILRLSMKTTDLQKLSHKLIEAASTKEGKKRIAIGIICHGKPRKLQQNRFIVYSILMLFVLSAIGGYALKFRDRAFRDNVDRIIPLMKDRNGRPKESKLKGGINRRADTQTQDSKTVQEEPGQKEKAIPAEDIGGATLKQERPQFTQEVTEENDKERLEHGIKSFLVNWKTAWEHTAGKNGDFKGYMSSYSDNFSSKGLDKNGWKRDKAVKNRKKTWIEVKLENLRITKPETDSRIEVRFSQSYRSSNYSEKSNKKLILRKEKTGWKIMAEESY